MTHQDIIDKLRAAQSRPNAVSPGEIGDYISLALSNGWTRGRVVAELTLFYLRVTGMDYLDRITHLVDVYVNEYGTETIEVPVPKKLNGAMAVKIEGVRYDSMKEASKSLGISWTKVKKMVENGEAVRV